MEWAFEVSRKASAAGAAVYLFQWRIGFWSPTLSELRFRFKPKDFAEGCQNPSQNADFGR